MFQNTPNTADGASRAFVSCTHCNPIHVTRTAGMMPRNQLTDAKHACHDVTPNDTATTRTHTRCDASNDGRLADQLDDSGIRCLFVIKMT